MADSRKSQDKQQAERSTEPDAMGASDYDFRHSGRRAAGHGGGDMDAPKEFPEAHHQTGHDYSGGGRGHESNRSLGREADEDLESRSGPYNRAGQPAQPRGEAEDKLSDKSINGDKT